ncbi:MAG: hypothetical protein SFT92_01645, partial [Rickettsiales bacterium]|nr:hypothetical protein [Rickettsiales bacterium]
MIRLSYYGAKSHMTYINHVSKESIRAVVDSLDRLSDNRGSNAIDLINATVEAYKTPVRTFHGEKHREDITLLPPEIIKELAPHIAEDRLVNTQDCLKVAGFFHDVVYAAVDGGISNDIQTALQAYGEFSM